MSPTPRPGDPVVTGIGALTPLGLTAAETWQGLVQGRSGIGPVTSFDVSALPVRIGGEIRGFDAERELGAKRVRRSARFSQLAVVAARQAVADAGLDLAAIADRVGVLVNSAVGGLPRDRARRPGHVRPRPARGQPVLGALDDQQHAGLRGRDRLRGPRSRFGQRPRVR